MRETERERHVEGSVGTACERERERERETDRERQRDREREIVGNTRRACDRKRL